MEELKRALAARGMDTSRFPIRTGVAAGPPESFRIEPGRITGGDERGLMYGLLEAAEQIRQQGRLRPATGAPATPIRGIRRFLHNEDLEEDWYYSREHWLDFFAMLARNRFNRFNLVFAHQTNYLAPPYPFWLSLPEFPQIRVPGLTAAEQSRNLEMLRFISQTAEDHGIDFALGVWEHNIQTNMKPTVEGLTRDNIGPYSYAALRKILAECPAIRSVQMRTNAESGIPADQQVDFFGNWVFRAIREAGRPVMLDLRAWALAGGMIDAARRAGVPLRVSTKYWSEDLGRPYQPAETFPGYSYMSLLQKPRSYEFYWEVWALGSHRLLLWGDPNYVRRAAPTFTLSGSRGFEIDPPLAQKGFGNRPGKWGVFVPEQSRRVFWKHEFERYWMFYLLWGRLSYDPATPETAWTAELERRFGPAAADVLEAYRASSGILSQIVAAHLADPNMYIWPEINPGGLIDAYREVRPSDWRYIATVAEAVRNRIQGAASAKQTPAETAARLEDLAGRAERAVERARAKLEVGNAEWQSSEPDFLVLASLARYHARKQVAAERLTWFYETGYRGALDAAGSELTAALGIWEKLVELTDGLYPPNMAFGPDDFGHWKDKLPYVRHDVKLIEERRKIFEQFGRFDFGFDFGGPVAQARGASYRNDPYVLRNTAEPRFQPVDPEMRYAEAAGYGWASEGFRQAHEIPRTPYHQVRAVTPNPTQLPQDALFGDWIEGRGAQTFRIRTGPGEFTVWFLHPDRSTSSLAAQAQDGVVDIRFPEGEWKASGVVVKRAGARPEPTAPAPLPAAPPRPAITHTPPKSAVAGRPLSLSLRVSPAGAARSVRLHYRALNQLVPFKTLEAPAARPDFIIPAEDVPGRWDLMYYFEILSPSGGGWFEPDPWLATPYFVVAAGPARD
jgi:hypothetical protein